MEWLMIIVFIVISVMDSKKKSDQAKQKREQRMQTPQKPPQKPMQSPIQKSAQKPVQKTMEQQVYRSGDGAAKPQARPAHPYQPKPSAEKQPEGPWYESFGELIKDLGTELKDMSEELSKEFTLDSDQVPNPMQKKKAAAGAPKKAAKPNGAAKKSAAALPTKTLMEQRPDREKREEHTKVTASVKPLTANVKPLKNSFEHDENCEHRVELNPNIQYSNRKQQTDLQRAAIVKTDSESLIQGVIWSEILGKPRAHQPMEQRFRRR